MIWLGVLRVESEHGLPAWFGPWRLGLENHDTVTVLISCRRCDCHHRDWVTAPGREPKSSSDSDRCQWPSDDGRTEPAAVPGPGPCDQDYWTWRSSSSPTFESEPQACHGGPGGRSGWLANPQAGRRAMSADAGPGSLALSLAGWREAWVSSESGSLPFQFHKCSVTAKSLSTGRSQPVLLVSYDVTAWAIPAWAASLRAPRAARMGGRAPGISLAPRDWNDSDEKNCLAQTQMCSSWPGDIHWFQLTVWIRAWGLMHCKENVLKQAQELFCLTGLASRSSRTGSRADSDSAAVALTARLPFQFPFCQWVQPPTAVPPWRIFWKHI